MMDRNRHCMNRFMLSFLLVCGLAAPAFAQANAAADQPETAPAVSPAEPAHGNVGAASADVVVVNRTVVTLRSPRFGYSPADRAADAERKIEALIDQGVTGPVNTVAFSGGYRIEVGGKGVFNLWSADVDPLSDDTLEQIQGRAAKNLQEALQASWEQRRPGVVLRGLGFVLLATIILGFLIWLCYKMLRKLVARMARLTPSTLSRVNEELAGFFSSPLRAMLIWLMRLGLVAVILFLAYVWLGFSLRQFPLTRPWGDALRGFLLDMLARAGAGFLSALPGLGFVVFIFFVTRAFTKILRLFFFAVEEKRITMPGMYPDNAPVTRRLVIAAVWIFALVMAYPYLPGSESPAFKGVSLFLGLLISFGSSGVISQAASGIIMVYSRAFKPGDYVRIDEIEGTVVAIGILSTKIRTNKRELVNIPNSVLTGSVSKNYSSLVEDKGIILHTSLTIGYDTPWRQVHGLLLLAADRTAGLRKEPKPFVYQTALSDFYVEYQLNAYMDEPRLRPRVLAELHANIQDAFNEFGVQIMSPNYEADPESAKLVPKERWYSAPAVEPEAKEGS